ncbi:2Fe-2S iron-sulfur cluster binding domain-containing protein [Haloferax sp. MBLA0076]|uniref:2Fe-2S iron-sulfur cluster binding domain-containing protein n=1 Tax=Haloferax litoreum TaxID=2666140 RepID=A0A6A8GKL5_9EURY|nr:MULTISPECIES: 2Fe-2S iron-sulfur cluster-binding protein [Haloferax]KAB1194854.1 2Fe-2S iron-sulfur cluster binding domain-containing protein [Haloferax sp. CBA1148]MRX22617.1 2Fe-2S iron-sulfur cluster binding domain-containing protein [Haloferax litoreum]
MKNPDASGDERDDVESRPTSTTTEPESDTTDSGAEIVVVRVRTDDSVVDLDVERGRVLRDVLLDADLSPYTSLTERANCGGRGLCATCGVRVVEGETSPTHWHDRLASRFGYPRLSCQILVEGAMEVDLVEDKRIWGGRE